MSDTVARGWLPFDQPLPRLWRNAPSSPVAGAQSAAHRNAAVAIRAEGLAKSFGSALAVSGLDLDVRPGELLALLGPSGSGKTTLLRLVAGLEVPTGGRILFGAEDPPPLPVRERRVGFVFQNYALFKHLSVAENV